jgi:AAA ATPase domain/Swt1-like HEPN
MSLSVENPFASFGTIVSGTQFIGRKERLRDIEQRVISPTDGGNLAIIGNPRIGKSSLAYHAIMERKKELLQKSILPIWINLATYETPIEFFRALARASRDILDDLDKLRSPLREAAADALQGNITWQETTQYTQRFFELIRREGMRILVVLDEFDHARNLFKGHVAGFQGLRELSYRPEWRVTFITISRRSIRDIETQTRAISTLDGIFDKLYLSTFNSEDLDEYFQRLTDTGFLIDESIVEKMSFYAGGHPYLLAMLGYDMIENFRKQQTLDIEMVTHQRNEALIGFYEQLIALLREDSHLDKLLQIVFGPGIDIKQADINEFLHYGLIKKGIDGVYLAYSKHFQSYLSLIDRGVELWSIWRETEKALRVIIAQTLLQKYGDDWFAKLEKLYPRFSFDDNNKNLFQRCREAQQKDIQNWGNRASTNLLDYTYSKELFDIITKEWNNASFKLIFGKDTGYWQQRGQLLGKVRNPLAHNRDEAISEHERHIAEGYCKEILETLRQYRDR